MPANSTFGELDTRQLDSLKRMLADAGNTYIRNELAANEKLEDDLDKDRAVEAARAYARAVQPLDVEVPGPKDELGKPTVEKRTVYPSKDRVLAAHSRAISGLAGGGRHSRAVAEHLGRDIQLRGLLKDKADTSIDKFQWYLGLAEGDQAKAHEMMQADDLKIAQAKSDITEGRQIAVGKAGAENQKELAKFRNSLRDKVVWKSNFKGANGNIWSMAWDSGRDEPVLKDTGAKFQETGAGGAGGADARKNLSSAEAFEGVMKEYEKILGDVSSGRIAGAWETLMSFIEQSTPARTARGMQKTVATQMARVINGERGMLTNQDIDRATAMVPLITDNDEERADKFRVIYQILEERKKAYQSGDSGRIHVPGVAATTPEGLDDADMQAFKEAFGYYPSSKEEAEAKLAELEAK